MPFTSIPFHFLPFSLHPFSSICAVDDASGHYTSGFFYGNNYWMGSLALCDAIDDGQIVAPGKDNSSSAASSPESETKNSGLPFAAAHTQGYSSVYNAPPPFVPGFYVIKMQLNETLPTQVVRKSTHLQLLTFVNKILKILN